MRVESDETTTTLIARPLLERLFNGFSAVAAGLVAWLCLRFYDPGGGWGDLIMVLFTPFLVLVALASLWRMLTRTTAVCRVDGKARIVEWTLRAPLVRRRTTWRFDDVEAIRPDAQSGYDWSWRPVLMLRDGRRVALVPHGSGDRESVERFVSEARRIMTTG
ncbi:MAG: hypothetical protein AB7O88_06790 [Reyranellaceae bacterium]